MARLVVGIALCAIGVVWIGQGIGAIGGSFMSGEAIWAVIGAVTGLIGGALIVGWRRDRSA